MKTINRLEAMLQKISSTKAIIYLVLFFFLLGFGLRHVRHNDLKHIVVGSDPHGYYQYLPAFFIEHDLRKQDWTIDLGNGNRLNKYTSGVAIMQIPFFGAAHILSYITGFETNGWSALYFLSVLLATSFYASLSLFLLFLLIKKRFGFTPALITTALMFLATNMYYYTVREAGMSHIYSFFLFSLFLYLIPVFFAKPSIKNTILIAIPFALAVLIRPTNILLVFFFLLFDVYNFNQLKERMIFFLKKPYTIALIALIGFVVFLPQMLYWHLITGKYIYYSYQGEGFPYWNNPQLFTVLLGKRNGWLLYAPIMLAGLWGLRYSFKNKEFSPYAVLLTLLTIIYINSSWWSPTFSAAYGYRALLEYQPLLALPLASVVHAIAAKKNKILQNSSIALAIVLIYINIKQSYLYEAYWWWDREFTLKIYLDMMF